MKQITEMTKEELYKLMTEEQKRYVYCMQDAYYVYMDCMQYLLDRDLPLSTKEMDVICLNVAYRFAFESKFDCNLSYWDNINNLIDKCLEGNGE